MRRRIMMLAMEMEDDEVKEWKLIKDYTVPEGEIVSTIGTPTEEEMEGISELLIIAKTYAINKDGSQVTVTSPARPITPLYKGILNTGGRISGDINNSIGKTTDARTCFIFAKLVAGMIVGFGDNASYSINSHVSIRFLDFIGKMPQINIGNDKGYSYSSGSNIKVYGR